MLLGNYFHNINKNYRNFSFSVNNYKNSREDDILYDFPTVEDGLRGMKFIDAVIESSNSSKWINI